MASLFVYQLFLGYKNSYSYDIRTVIIMVQEQLLLGYKNRYSYDVRTVILKGLWRQVHCFTSVHRPERVNQTDVRCSQLETRHHKTSETHIKLTVGK